MALFNTIFIVAILFVVSLALITPPTFAEEIALTPELAPSPDYDIFQSLQQPEKKFLDNCGKQLSSECADDIVEGMWKETNITDDCCIQLVKMGRKCDKHLVRFLIKFPEFKPNATLVKSNAAKVWSKCALVAKSPSPASPA